MDKINPFRNSEKDELVNAVRAVLSGQKYEAPEKEVEEHKGDKPHKHPHEEMDPVNPKAVKKKFKDRKDKDIDNDGDVDNSDKFLHKRRKAISKAVAKKDDGLDEGSNDAYYAMVDAKDKAKRDGKVWAQMGQDEKDRYIDREMRRAGYVKHGSRYVKEDTDDNPANRQHLCAKNVVHEQWGEGECISTMHADPDEEGHIAWYDVMFEHGIEAKVSIDELKVTKAEDHIHSSKKKNGKKDEVDTKPTTGDDRGTAEQIQ